MTIKIEKKYTVWCAWPGCENSIVFVGAHGETILTVIEKSREAGWSINRNHDGRCPGHWGRRS